MTLIEQIKRDREAGTPQTWSASTTTCRDLPQNVFALYWDKYPGGRKNEDGTTSFAMKYPMLLASEWMGDQAEGMAELADMLNLAERAKAALLAADRLQEFVALVEGSFGGGRVVTFSEDDMIECREALTAYRKATEGAQ